MVMAFLLVAAIIVVVLSIINGLASKPEQTFKTVSYSPVHDYTKTFVAEKPVASVASYVATDLWLAGDGGYDTEVVGESFCQDEINDIVGGKREDGHDFYCEASLVCEDDNEHDSNAVAVEIDFTRVGYLPRALAKKYRTFMKKSGHEGNDTWCEAKIVGGRKDEDGETHYGVLLDIEWPLQVEER